MSQIDFYVAEGAPMGALQVVAAKLCAKALVARKKVWLRTDADTDADALVDYIWGFEPTSFLPATKVGSDEAKHPIVVGATAPSAYDVVINLAVEVVQEPAARIIEIVIEDDDWKQTKRDAWVFYKQQGFNARRTEIRVGAVQQ